MNLRLIAITLMTVGWLNAQSQTGAEKMEFDVASVKQNKSDSPSNSNFPLGPGAVYVPNGGFFSATGFPLVTYIAFAYKLMANDIQSLLSELPPWAATDRFDIQARAHGDPSKAPDAARDAGTAAGSVQTIGSQRDARGSRARTAAFEARQDRATTSAPHG